MTDDKTGNARKRPPRCIVTRSMADAGKAKLDSITAMDCAEAPISDDVLVAEIFQAMWNVYWEQVLRLQGKNMKPPAAQMILPPHYKQ